MKIYAISDLHGYLPPPENIPPCDLLLISGDVCPVDDHSIQYQEDWLTTFYKRWMADLRARQVVWIGGNHDFALEKPSKRLQGALPGHYLRDTSLAFGHNGRSITIYGTPWTPTFGGWAFMRSEQVLRSLYAGIPRNVDILLSHGPPRGVCDQNDDGIRRGSKALLEQIHEKRPEVVICGHIHEARGSGSISAPPSRAVTTHVYNVSQMNSDYQPVHGAVEIVL